MKNYSKKDLFTAIVNRETITDEMVQKAQECLDAIAASAAKAKTRTPSPKQLAAKAEKDALNAKLEDLVYAQLSKDPVTAVEVAAMDLEGIGSFQKASRLLRSLVAHGDAVETEKDGKKAYTIK